MNPESASVAGIIGLFSSPDPRCSRAELVYYRRFLRTKLKETHRSPVSKADRALAGAFRDQVKTYCRDSEAFCAHCDECGYVPGEIALRIIPGTLQRPTRPFPPDELLLSTHPHVRAAIAFSLLDAFEAGV